ncbi:hypothetical protein AMK33_30245 [Streptomyces sp. CB02400]|nr:hypothetical protein AMK33_30245 [Streptomyces sp. CB02400]
MASFQTVVVMSIESPSVGRYVRRGGRSVAGCRGNTGTVGRAGGVPVESSSAPSRTAEKRRRRAPMRRSGHGVGAPCAAAGGRQPVLRLKNLF